MTGTYVHRVGTLEDGSYYVVRVEIRRQTGTRQTVTHGTVTDPLELAITGELYAPRTSPRSGHDALSAGQNVDDMRAVVNPAPGWTLEETRELAAIWDRWHLNTMRAACAHMPADAHARWDTGERVECAAGSGYSYGRAWLTEELPADILERVRYLMRDRSDAQYRARGYDGAGKPYPPATDGGAS